jgi:hypothetical protein
MNTIKEGLRKKLKITDQGRSIGSSPGQAQLLPELLEVSTHDDRFTISNP